MKIRNKYKIWATRWGLGLSAVGLFMILLPGMADIDGMEGGFALQFGGGFVLIMAIITVLVLMKYVRMFNRLSKFQNIIARWTVPAHMHKEYAEYDRKEDIERFRAIFWIISVISLLVGIILIILGLDFSIISLIILGLIALMYIVSRIAIISARNRGNTIKGDVIIAKEGGIINENLHNWSQMGSYIKKSKIKKVSKTLQVLEVTYSTLQRTGEVEYTARFPFPAEMTEEIKRVEEVLMA